MDSRHDRGFALLIVLWWAVLLALLGSQLAGTGRLEAKRAGNLRDAAVAEAAAEGALQEAAFHLLEGSRDAWAADGTVHTMAVAGGRAAVAVSDETGKIGLNQATAGLLAALLSQLGQQRRQAAALAAAILQWRTPATQAALPGEEGPAYAPPQSDFETLDELGLVQGITPALLGRLTPYLSVYQTGDPDLVHADPVVRAAWAQSGDIGATQTDRAAQQTDAKPIVMVDVKVEMASGARAAHRTLILLAEDAARHPFQVLSQER